MKKEAFDLINTYGEVVRETDVYSFYQLAEVKDRYDSNFMKLKTMPDCTSFEKLVDELKGLACEYGNSHGKIVLPENCKPDDELMKKAKELGFGWSYLEMYEVEPAKFLARNGQECKLELQVGWISDELVDVYGQLHFEESVQWGEAYATAIRAYKKGLIKKGGIRIAAAVLEGDLIGTTDVIFSNGYAEIDNFFVKPGYQKQGVGTAIQQFVMREAADNGQCVILVADGEDTPREMYLKQGYKFIAFQYSALCEELNGG